ncbi:MAG TPA: potassium-transporting ATPase subunit KdpC [Terracidiphilus sp.]|nr:potassium-transporting ATPase subunit KdpC [Terracidiphilus sp.]
MHSTMAVHEEEIIHPGHHAPEPPVKHSLWATSILFTVITAVIFGLIYPLVITGIAHVLFPRQAAGSLIVRNGQVIGSELIAQSFTSDKYFHPRPSNAGNGYDATASSGTNLAQSNAKLPQRMQADIDKLHAENPTTPVPIDAVTYSASGLDPDITPDNAYFQAPRVAKARGLTVDQVNAIIAQHIEHRTLGFIGEPRVNVLDLNIALDNTPSK